MIEVLTAALVVITGYYAWQTQQTVGEMRIARREAVKPRLAIDLRKDSDRYGAVTTTNVGLGPAVAAELKLTLEPVVTEHDPVDGWLGRATIPAGHTIHWLPPATLREMDNMANWTERIRVSGTMRDIHGSLHEVDEALDDLEVRWSALRPRRVAVRSALVSDSYHPAT
ncbi:MAG: hypothetical protein JW940_19640 [Polyangiaceae bacterium]|nr:hypothetical protein [Polyangiaceae bacterium]